MHGGDKKQNFSFVFNLPQAQSATAFHCSLQTKEREIYEEN